jgi:hypothetical protein
VLYISADLKYTIKNKQPESIATVLLSVFTPTNTEDKGPAPTAHAYYTGRVAHGN